jgi:hypothetical protein
MSVTVPVAAEFWIDAPPMRAEDPLPRMVIGEAVAVVISVTVPLTVEFWIDTPPMLAAAADPADRTVSGEAVAVVISVTPTDLPPVPGLADFRDRLLIG